MWQLMPGQSLRYHTWDNEVYVLYNDMSGDTHMLDAAAIEVLTALASGPRDATQLAQSLQLDAGLDSARQLAELLSELLRLALIHTTAC
ncbi:HPr-rel-A system PqqD family peptide chaperone [Pseudoduganella namucuonensis]|uniref:PqqD family protein, HPr-rel-A system n=1 Tax=Pseudoduganella namucuonensis TaxID=1035707 RepID=A0A1I7GG47_9BURK|nr:HPr-rel-A system PqqD family peptide chaperone [Pseudoduganella namucuonensis]SFU47383.1 PqqD family protein, HPr-rel-A system [Pseudoduganella namucuonensis]